MREFADELTTTSDKKIQANTTDSKFDGNYPGIDVIRDSFIKADASSNNWKDASLAVNEAKVKLFDATKVLGKAAAVLLTAEFEDTQVAHAETQSVTSS